ncbi:hypothetical protein D3C81_1540940 [compost metagenome]
MAVAITAAMQLGYILAARLAKKVNWLVLLMLILITKPLIRKNSMTPRCPEFVPRLASSNSNDR